MSLWSVVLGSALRLNRSLQDQGMARLMNTVEQPIKKSEVEVRQGSRTRLNLRVLVMSMAIAIVILGALYFVFFAT